MPFIGKLVKIPGLGEVGTALIAKSGGLADGVKNAYFEPTHMANKEHIERMQAYVTDMVANNPGFASLYLLMRLQFRR